MPSSSLSISNKCNSVFRRRFAAVNNQAVPNVIDALILQRSKLLGDCSNNASDVPMTERTRMENEINHLPTVAEEEVKKSPGKNLSWRQRAIEAAAGSNNYHQQQQQNKNNSVLEKNFPQLGNNQSSSQKNNSVQQDFLDEYGFKKSFMKQSNYHPNNNNSKNQEEEGGKKKEQQEKIPGKLLSNAFSFSSSAIKKSGCSRCGRPNHNSSNCNARTSIDDDICHLCFLPGHWERECKNVNNNNNNNNNTLTSNSISSSSSSSSQPYQQQQQEQQQQKITITTPTQKQRGPNQGTYVLASSVHPCYRYVGTSCNISKRFDQHVTGILGAKFTKNLTRLRRVRPIPLTAITVVPKTQRYTDETRQTLMQMRAFGVDIVRGAAFCKQEHTNADYFRLCHMFRYEDSVVEKQIKRDKRRRFFLWKERKEQQHERYRREQVQQLQQQNYHVSSSQHHQNQNNNQMLKNNLAGVVSGKDDPEKKTRKRQRKPISASALEEQLKRGFFFSSLEKTNFWPGFIDSCKKKQERKN
jgi:hypothetical protein